MHHTRTYYWFPFWFQQLHCRGSNPKPVMVPAELIFGALDGPWFHHCQTLTQSDLMLSVRAPDDSPIFWVGVSNGVGDKKLPLFKRDSRPPTTWLGKATALQLMMWRVKDVVCFQWNYWIPHRKFKKFKLEIERQIVLRHQVWLDVSTFNKCLFTTKPRGFLLILICETSLIFVWRNKAFIFFQKSDILFLHKTRINWDWSNTGGGSFKC